MDAESSRAVEEGQTDSPSSQPAPGRRFTSAGNRLQATLAAADDAAEEILESARREARDLIQRAEQVATDRTAQLQTQVEILLSRANDLTQQAQALGEATRELTSSVNRVVSVEAPAVTELELGSGEVEALTAGPLPPPLSVEAEPVQASMGEHTPAVAEPTPAATEQEPPDAEEPPPEAVETPSEPAPEPAQATPPGASGPRVSQPPPATKPAATQSSQTTTAEEVEPAQPKRRRSLFSRLRRGGHDEQATEIQRATSRPRASAESIAEVSPGHQMLARQMLLDGLSEEEVERRLRDEFRVQDPGAVLDSLELSEPLIPPAKDEGNA